MYLSQLDRAKRVDQLPHRGDQLVGRHQTQEAVVEACLNVAFGEVVDAFVEERFHPGDMTGNHILDGGRALRRLLGSGSCHETQHDGYEERSCEHASSEPSTSETVTVSGSFSHVSGTQTCTAPDQLSQSPCCW
jgi:hypothetical protein